MSQSNSIKWSNIQPLLVEIIQNYNKYNIRYNPNTTLNNEIIKFLQEGVINPQELTVEDVAYALQRKQPSQESKTLLTMNNLITLLKKINDNSSNTWFDITDKQQTERLLLFLQDEDYDENAPIDMITNKLNQFKQMKPTMGEKIKGLSTKWKVFIIVAVVIAITIVIVAIILVFKYTNAENYCTDSSCQTITGCNFIENPSCFNNTGRQYDRSMMRNGRVCI